MPEARIFTTDDLDRCRHGKLASERCPECDIPEAPWTRVDPRALQTVMKCPACRALVLDMDRDEHERLAHARPSLDLRG